jgi:hypothetical protein
MADITKEDLRKEIAGKSSVARSTEFSVDLPNSHKIYRSTDLNLKSTEKSLKKIFII